MWVNIDCLTGKWTFLPSVAREERYTRPDLQRVFDHDSLGNHAKITSNFLIIAFPMFGILMVAAKTNESVDFKR